MKHQLRGIFNFCRKIHLIEFITRILYYFRWKNPFRLFFIRLIQRILLYKNYSSDSRRLIIFLTSGFNEVNGGLLSINSIFNETCKLEHIHRSSVIMCTRLGGNLLLKYTKFRNSNYLYSLPEVFSFFSKLESLLIHVPELHVHNFEDRFPISNILNTIPELHINILLQNIELAPTKEDINKLKHFGRITCTTAHQSYSNFDTERALGCRLYKLSVFCSPEQYIRKAYRNKKNIMIISPDPHKDKSIVLHELSNEFPKLRLRIIHNMKYDKYKKVISNAKWAITFGEGLDGYFIEPIFCGGISFAVYNSKFFTEDFKDLKTVYADYKTLIAKICNDIKEIDNEPLYEEYNARQYNKCIKYYNYNDYVNNITSFYKNCFEDHKNETQG
jgi:hypothetical protein